MTGTVSRCVVVVVAALLGGCIQLGGEEPTLNRHAIDRLDGAATPSTSSGPDALRSISVAVRAFTGRTRFEARVVVRDASGGIELLEHERWVEDPADALSTVVRETAAAAGVFESVTDAAAGFRADTVVDGRVLACDVVEDPAGGSAARLRLRLDWAEAPEGVVLHTRVYERSRSLPDITALGPVMSANAAEIVADALTEWAELVQRTESLPSR